MFTKKAIRQAIKDNFDDLDADLVFENLEVEIDGQYEDVGGDRYGFFVYDYELENEAKEKITFEVFWNYLFPKFKWNKLESITKQETKEKIRKVLDDGVIVEFDDITCMVKDEPDLTSHVSSEATLYGVLNRNVIQLKVTLSNKQLDMAVDEFEDL